MHLQFHDSDDHRRARRLHPLHTGPTLSRAEGRDIFREMVRAETRNGRLSPLRRRRLIQYAAALQLEPVEASRIVTEITQQNAEAHHHATPPLYRIVETAAEPHRWPVWLKITLILAAAFAIDQLMRRLW